MSSSSVGIITLMSAFFILIAAGMKIVFAIGISTLITTLYLGLPIQTLAQNTVRGLNSFSLMSVPFFILAGEVMGAGGITNRLVKFSNALIGWIRGGLGMVNIAASMFFGGISGSPTADASSIGSMLIPVMEKEGYDTEFATTVTMASSVQGLLIPPSHNMVIFAMAAGGVSIGKLFLAGAVPGVFLGLALMVYCYFESIRKNYPKGDPFDIRVVLKTGWNALLGLGTVIIVVFGVVGGVFTATESAAIAVVWACFVTFFVYREIPYSEIWNILKRCVRTLSIVMMLVGISSAFGWLLSYLRVPVMFANFILGISTNKVVILLIINLLLIALGMIMDMISIILIVVPIIIPITNQLGVDPVHLGPVVILNLGIGLITPPVGVILFIGSALSKLTIERLTVSMLPFYVVMLAVLIIITYVPEISLYLPRLIMK